MFQMPPNGMLVDLEVGDLFPVDATEMEAIAGAFYDGLDYDRYTETWWTGPLLPPDQV